MATDLLSILGAGSALTEVPVRETSRAADSGLFDELLAKAVNGVVRPEQAATHAIEAFNHGTDGRLHETLLAVDKAEISLKLFVGVRNRLLDTYRELMKMGG